MNMVRKQVYITKEQDQKLKRLAKEMRVTEAELIRRGVETLVDDKNLAIEEAWNRIEASIRERQKLNVPPAPRTWTRDELYDDP